MQTEARLLAYFVIKVVGINGDQEPIEIEAFIRPVTDAKATINKEELPFAFGASGKDSH